MRGVPMKMSRDLARALVNANLMRPRDYAQRYWWTYEPEDEKDSGPRTFGSRQQPKGVHMAEIQYIRVDTDVTCLLTQDGRFVGAVKCSKYPEQPWAFAVDPDGLVVMNIEASEDKGEYLG